MFYGIKRGFVAVFLPVAGLAVSLCGGCSKPNSEGVKAIPPVVVNCHSAQSANCITQSAGATAYVGLSQGSVNCSGTLLSQGSQSLNDLFEVVGSGTVTVQGPFLVATVNQWFNFAHVRVYDLEPGVYAACAFIDLNNDGQWQPTEPIAEGQVEAGGQEVVIDGWS